MDNYAVLFGKSLGAGSGGSGTDNYNELTNKPSINGIALTGNKTSANLGLQDAISDLAAIRSGAAAGATAVQPADMRTALAAKQDTISDLSEIRSGAAAGSTAVQPAEFEADQQRQETEIGVVANRGAKNAFNPTDYIANSRSGVTITYNGDGTYSLSGTPTQVSDYLYTPDNIYTDLYGLRAGHTYTISTGVESSKVLVRIIPSYDGVSYDWSRSLVNNVSVKATFTIPDDVVGLLIDFRSVVNAGSLNGIVLKPMIRPAEITDDTFVPYAKTNRELTVAEDEDRAALVEQVDGGAKNLLKNTAQTQTVGGVTFTVNSDGSITANGTAKNTVEFDLKIPAAFSGKNYFVSGCPTGGATAYTYRQLIRDVTNQKNLGSDTGDGVGVTFPNPVENVVLRINIFSGYTANNLTFKPMICTASDYAISPAFVPYRPSWQEMYDMIKALQNGASTQSTAALMSTKSTIDPDVMPEEGEKQDE